MNKFLFLGSACMYPRECPQPMKEEMLLTGLPEYTNEGYALAKIGGSGCAPICGGSTVRISSPPYPPTPMASGIISTPSTAM